MRVLVTGSEGFVGRHVVKELEDNHELLTPSRESLDLIVQEASSLGTYFSIQKINAIVHLAATVAGLPGNIGNQGLFMYNNLQMALNVFEGARLAGVKKVVNLGSVCGYHDVGPKPFQEVNYWHGLPHESNRGYGMAKRASIMLGIEYARQYGMDVTNLVPINLVGEYDQSDHVVIDLIKKFESAEFISAEGLYDLACHGVDAKPEPLEYYRQFEGIAPVRLWGAGTATREFCYVGDLARAIAISLEKSTDAWPINIGTGKEISIKDLAMLIKKVGGYHSEITWDTTKPEGQSSRCLDIQRASDILRWSPRVTLEEAIRKTIHWYRANG